MANALQELVLRIGGDSSGGQPATRGLANALSSTLAKALQATSQQASGQAASASGHLIAGMSAAGAEAMAKLAASAQPVNAAMVALGKSLSGTTLIQDAKNIVGAVQQIGGASKLTVAEQAKLNTTLTEA